jgi:hypothetical protein
MLEDIDVAEVAGDLYGRIVLTGDVVQLEQPEEQRNEVIIQDPDVNLMSFGMRMIYIVSKLMRKMLQLRGVMKSHHQLQMINKVKGLETMRSHHQLQMINNVKC